PTSTRRQRSSSSTTWFARPDELLGQQLAGPAAPHAGGPSIAQRRVWISAATRGTLMTVRLDPQFADHRLVLVDRDGSVRILVPVDLDGDHGVLQTCVTMECPPGGQT